MRVHAKSGGCGNLRGRSYQLKRRSVLKRNEETATATANEFRIFEKNLYHQQRDPSSDSHFLKIIVSLAKSSQVLDPHNSKSTQCSASKSCVCVCWAFRFYSSDFSTSGWAEKRRTLFSSSLSLVVVAVALL
jgi:hypothetical protein